MIGPYQRTADRLGFARFRNPLYVLSCEPQTHLDLSRRTSVGSRRHSR